MRRRGIDQHDYGGRIGGGGGERGGEDKAGPYEGQNEDAHDDGKAHDGANPAQGRGVVEGQHEVPQPLGRGPPVERHRGR